nr:hypothetical protein [Tanacetum cinerariifolium]
VVTITGFRDLNEEFKECINNNSNEVNTAGSSVSTAGLNFINSTNEFSAAALCQSFEKLMKDKFQMSLMGELTLFLGKSASTPIDAEKPLLKDSDGEDVDVHTYRHMTGNMSYLSDFKELNGGYVTFGGNPKGGKITCKDFKLPDASQVLLRVPRENNMLGHVNLKTINKLVKGNLVRGLPSKVFTNDNSYVACKKGKQHRASCKFQRKVDEEFLVGYSVCSKAFRVFNSRTHIVQETLHVNFSENKPNVAGSGPAWLFDIDSLSHTMNYHPVNAENQTNTHAGFQDTEKAEEEGTQTYVLFPVLSDGSTNPKNNNKDALVDEKRMMMIFKRFRDLNEEFKECINNSSNEVNTAGSSVSTAGLNFINSTNEFSAAGPSNAAMPNLVDLSHNADDVGADADINNMESIISTRSMARAVRDQGGISQMFNEEFHTCMFACFLSQEEPKRVH